jgi:hypothetical protein
MIEAYWNLNRDIISIRSKHGKVIAYATKVLVRNARFVVLPSGLNRTLTTKQRTVHAFIRGELEAFHGETTQAPSYVSSCWLAMDRCYASFARARGEAVAYNPFRASHFHVAGDPERVIGQAEMALLEKHGRKPRCFAFDPCDMPEDAVLAAMAKDDPDFATA